MVYNIDWVFEISLTNKPAVALRAMAGEEGILFMWHNFNFYEWFDRHDASYDYLSIVAKKTMKENKRGGRSKKKSKGVVRKNLSRRHSVMRGK